MTAQRIRSWQSSPRPDLQASRRRLRVLAARRDLQPRAIAPAALMATRTRRRGGLRS
jgi:hypothetical protein